MKKRLNEKRNICLLMMLLLGNQGYGIEVNSDFDNEEIIKESNQTAIFLTGEKINIKNSGTVIGNKLRFPSGSWDTWGNGIGSHKSSADGTSSSIGNVINSGLIKGYSKYNNYTGVGNGISSFSSMQDSFLGNLDNQGVIIGETVSAPGGNGLEVSAPNNIQVGNINNKGVIKGITDGEKPTSGNGIRISGIVNNIGKIKNEGIISGYSEKELWGESNGIYIKGEAPLVSIDNKGTISGYSFKNEYNNPDKGSGIAIPFSKISKLELNNYGVIKGSTNAITYNNTTLISYNNNYGILAGKNIVLAGQVKPINIGTEILIDTKGSIVNIENGIGGEVTLEDGSKKNVINSQRYDVNGNITDISNAAKDSYTLSNGNHYTNNIINGAGFATGALVVQGETSVTDSIINGYNTAVYLDNLSQLTATNTVFNGGGLKNDVAVIKGSSGDNVASILGTSIINGNVDLGEGNDKLSIANTVQINGKLDGGLGTDILNLGEASITKAATEPNLNVLHDITGFESINTNGNITFFETVKISGANEITLESGNLLLRVDPTLKDSNGKIIGHALYGNTGILGSTGGNLVVGLNGIGENSIVSMGGTTIRPETNDSWWKETDHIKTNSLVLDGKLTEDGKNILIVIKDSIPLEPPITEKPPVDPPKPPTAIDSILYKHLNKVYKSIVSAGEIGKLANTTLLEGKTHEESLGGLLTMLDQIYANNPYAYTIKSSRDSLKLFEDNMSYLTIKPNEGEWIAQGKAIYTGVKNDNGASGKNYYGFDTGHRNYNTTTSTSGGLATFEYGLSDKTSAGIVVGGNNQNVNFKGSSKIEGNSLYLGTFAKTEIDNFKFMGGVGYQYTSSDADRRVSNKYDSFKTGDKYNINSYNAFLEAKYVYEGSQNWRIEPKTRLSYYYIDQESINEGYKEDQLSIGVDKANNKTADLEVGVDIIKSLYIEKAKVNNIFSLGVINTLGSDSKELKGNIIGENRKGSKFDIQGTELPRTSGKASYNLEIEKTNGVIYTAGVSMEFAEEYNRNINATVGIGYKF